MVIMSIPGLLSKKKEGGELSDEEVQFFIDCVCKKNIDRSQIGAMLMAFCLRGLSSRETIALTKSMLHSGTIQRWDASWKVVDKHSTGGVGDKVTFPLTGALAVFPLKIPMISGRGLGHTGGTADKLESIPGFKISLTDEHMDRTMKTLGCYITSQFGNIAPADKTLYSIRDITSTVCYSPLACASIMSKKLSEGIDSLILDVKAGEAAIAGEQDQAELLARAMVDIGTAMGVKTTALITEMDTPLGYYIGNSLEMIESLECMKGNGPEDLVNITAAQGAILLCLEGLAGSQREGEQMIRKTLEDGSALKKFLQILQNQGVSKDTADLLEKGKYEDVFAQPKFVEKIHTPVSGYVEAVHALPLGQAAVLLGGGRQLPSDIIDMAAGIKLLKTKGDKVKAGDALAEIHHNGKLTPELKKQIADTFVIGHEQKPIQRLLAVVNAGSPSQPYQDYLRIN